MQLIKEKFCDFVKQKLNVKINEQEKGVYLAVKYTQSNEEDLMLYIKDNNIPSTLSNDKFLSTVI